MKKNRKIGHRDSRICCMRESDYRGFYGKCVKNIISTSIEKSINLLGFSRNWCFKFKNNKLYSYC